MWVHCKPWDKPLRDNLTQTFAAFYPHSDQEHLLVWRPAWKGHNRDLLSFCTDRNVLIYTLSVHGHSRRPAVWESCPVWWHRDRSGCLSPALSSKHMQLNLDWLRRTTDAAKPPENWTHCTSFPFSTGCSVLFCFFYSGASACHLWIPRQTPYHHPHKHISVSGSTRRAQRAADWSWFA